MRKAMSGEQKNPPKIKTHRQLSPGTVPEALRDCAFNGSPPSPQKYGSKEYLLNNCSGTIHSKSFGADVYVQWSCLCFPQVSLHCLGHFYPYGLPNLWFACGWPFAKTMEITQTTKTTRTASNKELSAGFADNDEKHGNDENHRNPGCKPRVPKQRFEKYPTI